MPQFKRIQYHRYGGPELLRLESVDVPTPGKGEVLVRVRVAAANPIDWRVRSGDAKLMTGRRFPRGLGMDFAGIVEAVGAGVSRLGVGDEVLGAGTLRTSGAFGELAIAPEKQVVKKPAELSFEQAAAVPTVGVAALQCLVDKGKLKAGHSVFITGCLGGVGRTAVQVALSHGASVTGSCRDTAFQDAKTLGVTTVVGFDFDAGNLAGRFDLVFDTAGTLPIKVARTLLKPGGRILDINVSSSKNMAGKLARSVFSRDYQLVISKYTVKDLEQLAQAAALGKLDFRVARTVPLEGAVAALTELEVNHVPKDGKLLITIS
jgi:NADPH:quinone reductase-like Zn-dependent oxidoreductase